MLFFLTFTGRRADVVVNQSFFQLDHWGAIAAPGRLSSEIDDQSPRSVPFAIGPVVNLRRSGHAVRLRTSRQALEIAAARRSMSDSVSDAAISDSRSTKRPRQSAPPARQMLSRLICSTVARVSSLHMSALPVPKPTIT